MIKGSLTVETFVLQEIIKGKIFTIRGKKVLLDRDLALFYGVETKTLNRAVKRNIQRFPDDFMFRLKKEEFEKLKAQIANSDLEERRLRKTPYAFTDCGVLALSGILNSEEAIQVNIQIMRVFIKLRQAVAAHQKLRREIDDMEKRYGQQFNFIFEAIKQLLQPYQKLKGSTGFHRKADI